jgi:hypothetical protein
MGRGEICPVARAQRANCIRYLGKFVPCLAAGVDDVLVTVITAIGEIAIT